MPKKILPSHPSHFSRFNLRAIIQIVILLLAAIVLVPQFIELSASRKNLQTLSLNWLTLGLCVYALTNVFAAGVYVFICERRLPLTRTILVHVATGFTNRLLPSGIGGIGTHTLYLTRQGYKRPVALSLVLLNNLIGFLAFILALLMSGALRPTFLGELVADIPIKLVWTVVIAITVLFIILMQFKRFRRSLASSVASSVSAIANLAKRPVKFLLALFSSLGIATCFIGTLYCCLRAAGIELELHETVLVFGAGITALTASPTPGGIGATELAMMLALTTLGVPEVPALTAVLGFRIVSFWLPIVPGYVTFRYISAKQYI